MKPLGNRRPIMLGADDADFGDLAELCLEGGEGDNDPDYGTR